MKMCINCNMIIPARNKYCSIQCQKEYEYKNYITKWKKGEETGLRGDYQISMYLKTYLLKKYNYQCSKCGWNKKTFIQETYH